MTKSMYKTILSVAFRKLAIILTIVALFSVNESRASHATGADLTYQSLGNGQYLVTFKFYRDCFGITAPTSQTLTVSSTLCNFSQTFTMNQIPGTGQEITHPCSTSTTTCSGGSAVGIQLWEYTAVVTLNGQCADWQFNTSVSARNQAVTTIVNPDSYNLYVDAFLNNTSSENNSPTFSIDPIAFVCAGQTNLFNHGVTDIDGDSLVYSFVAPRDNANSPLPYATGFSVGNPFSSTPPVSIDPYTGDIVMNPTQAGEVAAVAVIVQEYRNGQLIGTVMRDMQIYILQCNNTNPVLTGIDTTNNFQTSTCVGSPLCFNVVTNDPDPNDTLTMTYNISTIPGATFVVSPGTRPTGTFCWTPTPADARPQPYTFTVIVRDNACPSNGVVTAQYYITVSNMNVSLTSTPSVACFGSHNGSASATATGNPPLQYSWSLPSGTILHTPSISHLGGGNYTLNVTDGNGCVGVSYFNIVEPAPLTVSIAGTNAGCGGSGTGSALATASGGTPNYTYSWSNGGTTDQITNLATGWYYLTVSDNNSCSVNDSVHIQAVTNVTFNITSTPATCVANDGSVTVTHSGGVGPYSYQWSNTTDTTISSQQNLIAGSYSVIATDLGTGCSQNLTTIVQNASGLSATITSFTDASCSSAEDGAATVLATGGQPPYAYLWPNGDTTAMTNHLAAGTHVVMVEDYVGCRAYASVTIGSVNPAPIVDLGQDTMPCIGTPYMMDAGPGGTSYLWSDNSTGQTLTVGTSGVYSVVVTNQFGCQSFDAITVTFVTCFTHSSGSGSSGSTTNNGTISISHPNTTINSDMEQAPPISVFIFPNPAVNEINLTVSNIRDTRVDVTINDILGNKVYLYGEEVMNGFTKKIDIHSLPAGIYMLKVEAEGQVNTTRIVKQ